MAKPNSTFAFTSAFIPALMSIKAKGGASSVWNKPAASCGSRITISVIRSCSAAAIDSAPA